MLPNAAATAAAPKKSVNDINALYDEGFKNALKGVSAKIEEHLRRKLQEFPPTFAPTRACGESFTVTTAGEITAVIDTFLSVLFPPDSPQAGLADIAQGVLFATISYDVMAAKVCMSCAEAEALLSEDILGNMDHPYGFLHYCASGIRGANAVSTVPIPTMLNLM